MVKGRPLQNSLYMESCVGGVITPPTVSLSNIVVGKGVRPLGVKKRLKRIGGPFQGRSPLLRGVGGVSYTPLSPL
ncbi:MAG TPA: hypothetical protein ACFYD1_06130, partial [Candidatus Hypogeohydataceae bacterium YC38]